MHTNTQARKQPSLKIVLRSKIVSAYSNAKFSIFAMSKDVLFVMNTVTTTLSTIVYRLFQMTYVNGTNDFMIHSFSWKPYFCNEAYK